MGFLGVGWIGCRRLEAIVEADIAHIVAIADPVPANVQKAARLTPDAAQLISPDELLGCQLDGVIIASPSALHAAQAIASLQAGCAVFCQKPLGRDAREVRQIIDAARLANRLLGVDLSYRHIRGFQKIRELIQAGTLGEIFGVELIFHNAYGPQAPWFYDAQLSGGGCVIDLGIHLVDAALWILDTTAVGVTGRVFSQGRPLPLEPNAVEDFAVASIDLACGAVAQLTCSWRLHAGRDAVIEAAFYGTRGGAALRNVAGSFHDFTAEHFTGTQSTPLAQPPDQWGSRAAVAWVRQLAQSPAYDPEIERQIDVAVTLDAIYGREDAQPLLICRRQ
jgi:predicted dehydrogenase